MRVFILFAALTFGAFWNFIFAFCLLLADASSGSCWDYQTLYEAPDLVPIDALLLLSDKPSDYFATPAFFLAFFLALFMLVTGIRCFVYWHDWKQNQANAARVKKAQLFITLAIVFEGSFVPLVGYPNTLIQEGWDANLEREVWTASNGTTLRTPSDKLMARSAAMNEHKWVESYWDRKSAWGVFIEKKWQTVLFAFMDKFNGYPGTLLLATITSSCVTAAAFVAYYFLGCLVHNRRAQVSP